MAFHLFLFDLFCCYFCIIYFTRCHYSPTQSIIGTSFTWWDQSQLVEGPHSSNSFLLMGCSKPGLHLTSHRSVAVDVCPTQTSPPLPGASRSGHWFLAECFEKKKWMDTQVKHRWIHAFDSKFENNGNLMYLSERIFPLKFCSICITYTA